MLHILAVATVRLFSSVLPIIVQLLFKSSDYSRVVWRLIKEIWYTNDHKCQVFTVPTKESGLLYLGQNGHMVRKVSSTNVSV